MSPEAQALSEKKFGVFCTEQLLIALCGGDYEFLKDVSFEPITAKIKNHIDALPIHLRFVHSLTLFLIANPIPPLSWRLRPFSKMSLDKQVKYLESWEDSRFAARRMMFKIVKVVYLIHLLSDPSLLKITGAYEWLQARKMGLHQTKCLDGAK
jgi:hypothetical protein